RRIELLTAIKDKTAKEKVIQILRLQCADNTLAHELQSDGSYKKIKNDGLPSINNHTLLEDYANKITKASVKESAHLVKELMTNIFTQEP
ncbi:MAG: RNA degradosome polyphosphate kinase, partial [Sulfurimonadaceae bacterium]